LYFRLGNWCMFPNGLCVCRIDSFFCTIVPARIPSQNQKIVFKLLRISLKFALNTKYTRIFMYTRLIYNDDAKKKIARDEIDNCIIGLFSDSDNFIFMSELPSI